MIDHPPPDVRPSPLAGQWYPRSPARLAASIDAMLAEAPAVELPGEVVGLVVPHAGHRYSGPVAARAFKTVQGLYIDRVVIVGPMHHPYAGAVITTAHAAYETPLGVVPVDMALLHALAERVPLTPARRDPEHSVEIELPFLQRALPGAFSFVPLMLRDQSPRAVQALGEALAAVLGDAAGTLLVASSDLSHFYPDAEARQLDAVMLEQIATFDPAGVLRVEAAGHAYACGHGAIAAVLVAARQLGAEKVTVVGYGTSADTGGGASSVVGYGAAAITRPVAQV